MRFIQILQNRPGSANALEVIGNPETFQRARLEMLEQFIFCAERVKIPAGPFGDDRTGELLNLLDTFRKTRYNLFKVNVSAGKNLGAMKELKL